MLVLVTLQHRSCIKAAASPTTTNDGCGGKTVGTARALHTSPWVIWHYMKLSGCELRSGCSLTQEASLRWPRSRAYDYSPKVRCCPVCIRPTHTPKGIYCNPLLMWHKLRATRCQHIKSLCAVDGGQPYIPSGQVDSPDPPQYFCGGHSSCAQRSPHSQF